MNPFEKIAEEKIREAIKKGEFEHLEGKGKPLDLRDYFRLPPHLRVGFSLLRNANILPREVELLREIAELKSLMANAPDHTQKTQLARRVNEKQVQLRLLLEQRRSG